MENYNQASKEGKKMILTFLKSRMKEKKITIKHLAEICDVSESTMKRYWSGATDIPLLIYLQILGALKIRPYLIPAEIDQTEMFKIDFN